MKAGRLVLIGCLAVGNLDAAVSDYTRTETAAYAGYEGATLVTWVKKSSPLGRAWALKFDMTKGFRLRCQYADGQKTVAEMGSAISSEGEIPVAGVNGDYFYNGQPTGAVISDSRLVYRGQDSNASMWMQFFGETADHEVFLGRLSRLDGLQSGNPAHGYDYAYNGRKVRNAQRVNWANYPVHNGKINPVNADYPYPKQDHSLVVPNTIGNYQPRETYPRTLVGHGTDKLGHATVVFFVSDGRQPDWSAGVADVDAYQMMINEGCVEVGECDGGGSATFWTGSQGCLNRPSDGSPRKLSSGFFILAPKTRTVAAQVGVYGYDTLAEARAAAAPGEVVERIRPTVGWFSADAASGTTVGCAWTKEPEVKDGSFRTRASEPASLQAVAPSPFAACVETKVTLVGGYTSEELGAAVSGAAPRAACAVREDAATLALTWCGLVYDGETPRWVDLVGHTAVSGEEYAMIQEFRRIGGRVHVRYRIRQKGMPVDLTDAGGVMWFPVPGASHQLDGSVDLFAPAGVHSIEGRTNVSSGFGVFVK